MREAILFCTAFLILIASRAIGQDCQLEFRSPVNHKTVLSGSFGEPRSRHFHAGIDFKQKKGIPYDTIYAVEDGFISRIDVQPDGYGNALLMNHSCNKTSVYAHLHEFAPKIKTYIEEKMIAQKRNSIQYKVVDSTLYFRKGQPIGILGNSGRSSGPHLHFEIRNTTSESAVNPGLFGFKPDDDIPPVIRGIMIYEITPNGQEKSKQYYPAVKKGISTYMISNNVIETSFLKVGVGIRTYDTMNGASNHNGIYKLEMRVDGEVVHAFSLDSIPFHQSKYIHSHMDYEAKLNRQYIMKCFKNPGNQLDIYRDSKNNGEIYTYDFRPIDIEIKVLDLEGNEASVTFQLQRSNDIPKRTFRNNRSIEIGIADSMNITLARTKIQFPVFAFCQPVHLEFKDTSSADEIILEQKEKIPVFRHFKISHTLKEYLSDREKYIFSATNEKGEQLRYSAKWENDSTVITFTNALTNYRIEKDTIAPTISVISIPTVGSDLFKVQIKDDFVAVHDRDALDISIYVNDQWTLCQQDAKTQTTWFYLKASQPPQSYKIDVEVIDGSENKSFMSKTIVH